MLSAAAPAAAAAAVLVQQQRQLPRAPQPAQLQPRHKPADKQLAVRLCQAGNRPRTQVLCITADMSTHECDLLRTAQSYYNVHQLSTCVSFQALARPQHGHQPRQGLRQRQCAQPRPMPSLLQPVLLPVVPLASPRPPVPLRLMHPELAPPSSRQHSSRSLLPVAGQQPPAPLPHQMAWEPIVAQPRALLPQPTGARLRHRVLPPGPREAILRPRGKPAKYFPSSGWQLLPCCNFDHRVGCLVNLKLTPRAGLPVLLQ
jgi:hypothetical protein